MRVLRRLRRRQAIVQRYGNVGELIFWDAKAGEPIKVLPEARGKHFGAEIGSYLPDGKWAISGSTDRTIKCWDTKTFELLHTISGNPGPN